MIISCEASVNGALLRGLLHTPSDSMPDYRRRPAVVICPGGAYEHLSVRESDPPASALLAAGYQAFVLNYSVGEQASELRPLHQLADTVRLLRARAEEWHLLPDKITIMGFSAGGHLAASLGCFYPELGVGCRPDGLCLCYPVITTGAQTHRRTAELVSGGDPALRDKLSLEKRVHPDFPPTFLWHTADDGSVPAVNSLLFAQALANNGIPYELHIYPHGQHGSSMCTPEVGHPLPARAWFEDFLRFNGAPVKQV